MSNASTRSSPIWNRWPGGKRLAFDELYPQENGASALQQLQIQLANPLPYDLEGSDLAECRNLSPAWRDWARVQSEAARLAVLILDQL